MLLLVTTTVYMVSSVIAPPWMPPEGPKVGEWLYFRGDPPRDSDAYIELIRPQMPDGKLSAEDERRYRAEYEHAQTRMHVSTDPLETIVRGGRAAADGDLRVTNARITVYGDIAATGSIVLLASERVIIAGSMFAGDGEADRNRDGGHIVIIAPEIIVLGEHSAMAGDGATFDAVPASFKDAEDAKGWTADVPLSARHGGHGGSVVLIGTYRGDGSFVIAGGHGGNGEHAPADAGTTMHGGDGGDGGIAFALSPWTLTRGELLPLAEGLESQQNIEDLIVNLRELSFTPDEIEGMPAGEPLPHVPPRTRGAPGVSAVGGWGGGGGQGSDATTRTGTRGEVVRLGPGDGGRGGEAGAAVAGGGMPGSDSPGRWMMMSAGFQFRPEPAPPGGTGGSGGLASSGTGGFGGAAGGVPPGLEGTFATPTLGKGGRGANAIGGPGGRAGRWSGSGGSGGGGMAGASGNEGQRSRAYETWPPRPPREESISKVRRDNPRNPND